MSIKRIIPCMDVRNGKVVKGVNFEGIREIENPVSLARYYNKSGADELVFYDITASIENRPVFYDLVTQVAKEITVPFTVGGGINTLGDIASVLKCGADKVSINSGVIKNPAFIKESVKEYGGEKIVFAMDIKRVDGKFRIFTNGGKINTEINALDWTKMGEDYGAGELVINSIDTDGIKKGFDLEMLEILSERVSIPIIASGGAGKIKHFIELFQTLPKIDAGLAASVFHFKEISIVDLKKELIKNHIEARL